MPILLAGEDAASDCFAGAGTDAGLLAGGDWARRGVAKHNVATTRRGLAIECLPRLRFWTHRGRASEPMYRKVDDVPYRSLLVKIPVKSAVSEVVPNWTAFQHVQAHSVPIRSKI